MTRGLSCFGLVVLIGLTNLPSAASAAPPDKSDKELLQGTWVCEATIHDGKSVKAYVGVKAVISGDDLTWYFPQKDGTFREQKNKFRIDDTKEPRQFDWWRTDKAGSVDFRLYTVTENTLRWSTNLDYKTRPKTFEFGRWQFTAKRKP